MESDCQCAHRQHTKHMTTSPVGSGGVPVVVDVPREGGAQPDGAQQQGRPGGCAAGKVYQARGRHHGGEASKPRLPI
eukprot:scaffold462543_cov48-Prasinocladus_malaysianus.AAC.1